MVINKALSEFLRNLSGSEFFSLLLSNLIGLGFIVGTLFFVFNFIYGAIDWMASGGNKNKIEIARKRLTLGILGIMVLFSFFAIIGFIGCFFGIDLLRVSVGRFNVSFAQKVGCF